jgi:AcrR family transcriptional regulator
VPSAQQHPETNGVRQRILDAAREQFAARGFDGASVRTIGTRAGVTPSMINYYFRSKTGLHEEVVQEALGRLLGRIARATAGAGTTPGELASGLVGAYFDFLSEERALQQLLMREVLDGSQRLAEVLRRQLSPLVSRLEQRFGGDDRAFQTGVSLFGAVAGYFLYAPVLAELFGQDPLSGPLLARRRAHVLQLTTLLSNLEQQGSDGDHLPQGGEGR